MDQIYPCPNPKCNQPVHIRKQPFYSKIEGDWVETSHHIEGECKNPKCNRYMITLEISRLMSLTDEDVAKFNRNHTIEGEIE